MLLQAYDIAFDCLPDILRRFTPRLALGDTARKSRASRDEHPILVLFQVNAILHSPSILPELNWTGIAWARLLLNKYAAVLRLITAFWNLQIQNPQLYNKQAERSRIRELPLLAPRGKILDRDGRIIVDNHSSYSLILTESYT